ncbi:hypothetical protein [Cohnella candidum]|uniref:hypothetical protein n=1 Tax=Cohnella candidum TaxID=2674991 RepID=UPI0013DE053F|nr:hypothetical protein [Cohnella candidum]
MAEEKKPAEQEPKAQQEIELNDLEQELTNQQQDKVEGGWGGGRNRPRVRGS